MALGLTEDRYSLPGGEVASWLGSWTNVPGIVLTTVFLPLLFPDGHVASRRWRPVAWLGAAVAVVPMAILAVAASLLAVVDTPCNRPVRRSGCAHRGRRRRVPAADRPPPDAGRLRPERSAPVGGHHTLETPGVGHGLLDP
jgi:hypothetical protein